jgi:hypothetical protein
MGEEEFWEQLRFRINCLSRGYDDPSGYCDWFTPRTYVPGGSSPRIVGKVGFVGGRETAQYGFTFALPAQVVSRESIDWELLLPPKGSVGWLSFDQFRSDVSIDTSAATLPGDT